ncbi:hypothetical protein [Haloferula sp.]|uniref:hypothetical protein n=1 Tax=Haloferula sp. TaxID=2497595 RepID=UPI003C7628E1
MYQAHHDFPWEKRRWFAEHGIDVNDVSFGRWAHKEDHKVWHQGAGGGDFNDWWDAVEQQELNDGIQLATAQILLRLIEVRDAFPSTK